MLQVEARKLRANEIEMLVETEPNWLLTFSCGYQATSTKACSTMTVCFNAFQREFYGRDWTSSRAHQWPVANGYFEHPDSNPHHHTLVRCSNHFGKWVEICGERVWQKFMPRGQLHVIKIQPGEELKVARYCTKDLARYQRFDDIFRYSDTRRRPNDPAKLIVGRES
jgi:hypothetical protein